MTILRLNNTKVFDEVRTEMFRQLEMWGEQNHKQYHYPDVFDLGNTAGITAQLAKDVCEDAVAEGNLSWQDILNEEVLEAREEAIAGNNVTLREELIQVAAVAMSAVMSLDRATNRCPACGMLNGEHKMSCYPEMRG